MRKQTFLPLFLCLFFSLSAFSQSSDYIVQVAAFETQVSIKDYFKGLSGIYYVKDHNDIHKYLISGFADEAAASATAQQATALGYNARVIDMGRIRNACSLACGMAPKMDPSKIQSIFFDFDRSTLRTESKRQLDQLYTILSNNPNYNAELNAHTDAKGSFEYNEALSTRRANAAKKYLESKGISSNRLRVSTFGEKAPIAKNELEDGRDTAEGRQYNRRVELKVVKTDGQLAQVVEDINVPAPLRQQ